MNSTLVKNIEFLLARENLNAYQLQEKSDIPQSTTFRIVNGDTTSPSSRTIKKYADFFNVPAEDLMFKDLSEIDNIEGYSNISPSPRSRTLLAPVLNYVQAGHFCEYADDAIADEFEPYDAEYGEGCYWVVIQGKSMEPNFYAGDKVLVKKDIQPSPGDYVVAMAYGKKEVTFKKYRPRGFDSNGKEYAELVPSNPDFPIIDSRHLPFEICGIALERKQKLR